MAKLYFYYSSMNAGKSTTLLQSAYNYRERGMDALIYTPTLDKRFGENKIASRIGLSAEATGFNPHFHFYEHAVSCVNANPKIRCVLIDEAQFLTKNQVFQLTEIADKLNIPVLAYGLRTDFQGETFQGSQYLLAWAEELVEIKTICHCGRKATMVLRLNADGTPVRDGNQIEIGGNERYLATCRLHFKLGETSSMPDELQDLETADNRFLT